MKTQRKTRSKQKNTSTSYEIYGLVLLLLGIFLFITLFGDSTGMVGDWLRGACEFMFGTFSLLAPIILSCIGAKYIYTAKGIQITRKLLLILGLVVIILTSYHHFVIPYDNELAIQNVLNGGGILGAALAKGLHIALGDVGASVLLLGATIIDILLLTHWSLSSGAQKVGGSAQKLGKKTGQKIENMAVMLKNTKAKYENDFSLQRLEFLVDKPKEFIYKKDTAKDSASIEDEPVGLEPEDLIQFENVPLPGEEPEAIPSLEHETQESEEVLEPKELSDTIAIPEENIEPEETFDVENPSVENAEATKIEPVIEHEPVIEATTESALEPTDEIKEEPGDIEDKGNIPVYQFPPLSLLHSSAASPDSTEDIQKKAQIIESTLKSFGVSAKVIHTSIGPTVTRFELKPEIGTRVSKIEGLSNELAMALSATHIRIEAPIPGKPAVGIEIPNLKSKTVALRDVLSTSDFQDSKGHIMVALGKDITGKPVITDLAKMPHLLIAGSTGSGKSVCINTIIASIIYHSKPEDVKLMLIDPKVVELSVYNGIPHLRTEVVTDMKKAQGTLNWAVREMEARYQLFAGARVRNIEGYNSQNPDKKMPYILIIVDEFADLMNVAAKEVEVLIQRLTQKARAAGIHLILATQRPSADVITGVIKSNIPSRIAFMVESNLNSRIILDEGGAESLLGKGDMLFKQAGALNTLRVQGAFISDEEVESVVDYLKKACLEQEKEPVVYEPIDLSIPDKSANAEVKEEEKDEILEEASEWVLDTKRASVSALQRRFRIGYTRAGRLMDTMEKLGIVGPAEGAKPREILMSKQQLTDLFNEDKRESMKE